MNSRNSRPDYSLLSKYRALLMGVAILLIMFCHLDVAQGHNGMEHTHLAGILHTGTVGVDVFLFLSGIGLYYSYAKKQIPYWTFEKKRLFRILPYSFIIGGATYLLYDILISHFSLGTFLRDLFFISWFREGSTRYWYVLAVIVFYLLFPALYRFIHGSGNAFMKTILFCAVWWVVAETLCHSVEEINRFRIALDRLPIFMIGIYTGKLSYEKRVIQKKLVVLYILFGFFLFALLKRKIPSPWSVYLYYPIRGALAISIIATVILIMETLEKKAPGAYGVPVKVLGWLGGLTYELYLLHQSYMILFDFPYKFPAYFTVAFALPTITAAGIWWARNAWNQRNNT